jgi:hypothetical protein
MLNVIICIAVATEISLDEGKHSSSRGIIILWRTNWHNSIHSGESSMSGCRNRKHMWSIDQNLFSRVKQVKIYKFYQWCHCSIDPTGYPLVSACRVHGSCLCAEHLFRHLSLNLGYNSGDLLNIFFLRASIFCKELRDVKWRKTFSFQTFSFSHMVSFSL